MLLLGHVVSSTTIECSLSHEHTRDTTETFEVFKITLPDEHHHTVSIQSLLEQQYTVGGEHEVLDVLTHVRVSSQSDLCHAEPLSVPVTIVSPDGGGRLRRPRMHRQEGQGRFAAVDTGRSGAHDAIQTECVRQRDSTVTA